MKIVPFEFVAMRACLEAASSSFEHEALSLESEAHIALDKLTSKISTLNLELVQQIKTRLVSITARVQKVRDELEHLLQMYLSQKLENSSNSSMNESDITVEVDHDLVMSNKFDVEEVEILLKSYFVEIDGTLNKLSKLKEYLDDTEENISKMLDDKEKHLLRMNEMLTMAMLVMSFFLFIAFVTGNIFSMFNNITIEVIKEQEAAGPSRFLWTVIGASLGSLGAICWFKYKQA